MIAGLRRASPLRALRRAVYRGLLSRRAAVATMALMAGLLALASLVPEWQSGSWDSLAARAPVTAFVLERLRPRELVQSPAFLLLPAYLFAAIAVSIAVRLRAFQRARRSGHAPRHERFRCTLEVEPTSSSFLDAVAPALRRAGFGVRTDGGGLVARRGELGFLGSIAFHLGLLVVLAGVAASRVGAMAGEIVLTEGFPVPLARASFRLLDGELAERPERTLTMRDFAPEYSAAGTNVDFAAVLAVADAGRIEREAVVRVNQELDWEDLALSLQRYGFAPELVVHDARGRRRLEGTGVLQLLPPGKPDTLPLEGGGALRLRLFPDHALAADGQDGTRSMLPRNPVLAVTWLDGAGREVGRGQVARGGELALPAGTIRFVGLSYWAGFMVARDPGVWLFIAGFALGLGGLVLRFLFPDQLVEVRPLRPDLGGAVRVVASTRFFPALQQAWVEQLVLRLQNRSG